MNPTVFGDSYNFVNRQIISGLAPIEHWAMHPMYFCHPRRLNFVRQYREFMGVDLVKGDIYCRELLVDISSKCPRHLYLDPDTGLWVKGVGGVKNSRPSHGWSKHLCVSEVAKVVKAPKRRHKLTLVFDQSYSNSYNNFWKRKEAVKRKLDNILQMDIYGAAYVSHAVFIWFSADKSTVIDATRRLRRHSGIPVARLVGDGA